MRCLGAHAKITCPSVVDDTLRTALLSGNSGTMFNVSKKTRAPATCTLVGSVALPEKMG